MGRNAQKPYSLSALLTWLGDCGMVLAVLVIFVSPLVVPDRTVLQIGAFAILMRNKERAVVMYNVTANTYGRYDVPVTRCSASSPSRPLTRLWRESSEPMNKSGAKIGWAFHSWLGI